MAIPQYRRLRNWAGAIRSTADAWMRRMRPRTKSVPVPAADPATLESPTWRYWPCKVLKTSDIPHVVWFEDALASYGSDTAVFDLYILVPDSRTAADVLARSGFREAELTSLFPNDDRECRGGIHLKHQNSAAEDHVVLINAFAWNYDLGNAASDAVPNLPPLDRLIESLMRHWIEMPEPEYKEKSLHAMTIACLMYYCYSLEGKNGPLVKSVDFAQHLQPEFHELHFDLISTYMEKGRIMSYRKHEYHALRYAQIKEGSFTARPYPSDVFPPSLAEYPHLTGLEIFNSRSVQKRKRQPLAPLEGINEDVDESPERCAEVTESLTLH